MKSLVDFINEERVEESKGSITFSDNINDYGDLYAKFAEIVSLSAREFEQIREDEICDIQLYGGKYNGRHIYMTLYCWDTKEARLKIGYSKNNKKPAFNIFKMKKVSRMSLEHVSDGIEGVVFDLGNPNKIWGDKQYIDDLFGKPMPWRRGDEYAICETISAILMELGSDREWTLIKWEHDEPEDLGGHVESWDQKEWYE